MKIYHYTTIENLALILHYKTLRFNNAKNVNDPEEAITEDFGSLKDYLFMSCWSKASNESIPLWKMYSNSGKGIRLEVDTEHIHIRGLEYKKGLNCVVKNVINWNQKNSFIKIYSRSKSSGYTHYYEMNYSDEIRNYKEVINENTCRYNIVNAFNTKKKCWSFEEEIRFILLGCSSEKKEDSYNWQTVFQNINTKKAFSLDFIDLVLEDDFFSNLTIQCGPLLSESDRIIIKALVEKYCMNFEVRIVDSIIKMNK